MAKKKNVYGAKRMKEALTGYAKSVASHFGGGGYGFHRNIRGSAVRKKIAEKHKANRKYHQSTTNRHVPYGAKGYRHELIKRHAM